MYPRLRVDYKTFDTSGQQEWHAAPSVRVDYRRRRGLTFEFESGYDWSNRQLQEVIWGSPGISFVRAIDTFSDALIAGPQLTASI